MTELIRSSRTPHLAMAALLVFFGISTEVPAETRIVRSEAKRIPLPTAQPSGLTSDGVTLLLSSIGGFRRIYRLDPRNGTVLEDFLAPSPSGLDGRGNGNGLAHDGASSLFVADLGDSDGGIVYEIDLAGPAILTEFRIPFRGGGIAFDRQELFIADFDSDLVLVTDRFGKEIRRFRTGLRPAGITVEPRGGNLWIISEFDSQVTELSPFGKILRTCAGPREPGIQGLGGVTFIDGKLAIAEVTDPDPFRPPDVPGTGYLVAPDEIKCEFSE